MCLMGIDSVLVALLQVLEALPDLGPYELRLGHTQLFAAAIAGMCLPPEVGASCMTGHAQSAQACKQEFVPSIRM